MIQKRTPNKVEHSKSMLNIHVKKLGKQTSLLGWNYFQGELSFDECWICDVFGVKVVSRLIDTYFIRAAVSYQPSPPVSYPFIPTHLPPTPLSPPKQPLSPLLLPIFKPFLLRRIRTPFISLRRVKKWMLGYGIWKGL